MKKVKVFAIGSIAPTKKDKWLSFLRSARKKGYLICVVNEKAGTTLKIAKGANQ